MVTAAFLPSGPEPVNPLVRRAGYPKLEAGLASFGQCAQYREAVLDADRLGDEEECALRDHFLAVHPTMLQPETLSVLLKHFVVTEEPPAA